MGQSDVSCRGFLQDAGPGCAATPPGGQRLAGQESRVGASVLISVDSEPRFDLSPYLYVEFMEPA